MKNSLEGLKLGNLREGELLRIIGKDDRGTSYFDFLVVSPGDEPTCLATVKNENGVYGPTTVFLRGTGYWTTRQQNPTQEFDAFYHRKLSIDYGRIHFGGNLVVIDPESPRRDMYHFVPPVKEIEIYSA